MSQPTYFTIDASHFADESFVRINWVYAPSAQHYAYDVYRRSVLPGDPYVLLYRTTGTDTQFDDYSACSSEAYEYVVQEVTLDASLNPTVYESNTGRERRTLILYTEYY